MARTFLLNEKFSKKFNLKNQEPWASVEPSRDLIVISKNQKKTLLKAPHSKNGTLQLPQKRFLEVWELEKPSPEAGKGWTEGKVLGAILEVMDDHEKFLRQAIDLSRQKMKANEGGPFGAVIVKDGTVIGTGWNQVTSHNDPTGHAEVVAIREACQKVNDFSLKGATIYASCEPCPMCLAAIYWARIDRIFFANQRHDAAKIDFDDEFLYEEIGKSIDQRKIPMSQLLRDEAIKVFEEWDAKTDKIKY